MSANRTKAEVIAYWRALGLENPPPPPHDDIDAFEESCARELLEYWTVILECEPARGNA